MVFYLNVVRVGIVDIFCKQIGRGSVLDAKEWLILRERRRRVAFSFCGTFFSTGNSSLGIEKVCLCSGCFVILLDKVFIERELGFSSGTVVDWCSFSREVCLD